MSTIFSEAKRRKILHAETDFSVFVTQVGTEIRLNGTMTPSQTVEESTDAMDTEVTACECPCGYLHGPGVHNYHDIAAVGFSADVMKGPD